MEQFGIYFDDLIPEVQKQLLKFYQLENEIDGNFDIIPLFLLEYEPETKIQE